MESNNRDFLDEMRLTDENVPIVLKPEEVSGIETALQLKPEEIPELSSNLVITPEDAANVLLPILPPSLIVTNAQITMATDSATTAAQDSFNCPFCGMGLESTVTSPERATVYCCKDKTPHHMECWRANGNRCTTLGCGSNRYIRVLSKLE